MSPNWGLHWLDFDLPPQLKTRLTAAPKTAWTATSPSPRSRPPFHLPTRVTTTEALTTAPAPSAGPTQSRRRTSGAGHRHLCGDAAVSVWTTWNWWIFHTKGEKGSVFPATRLRNWLFLWRFFKATGATRNVSRFIRLGIAIIDQQIDGATTSEWCCDGIVTYCDMFGVFFSFAFCFLHTKLCNTETFGAPPCISEHLAPPSVDWDVSRLL